MVPVGLWDSLRDQEEPMKCEFCHETFRTEVLTEDLLCPVCDELERLRVKEFYEEDDEDDHES